MPRVIDPGERRGLEQQEGPETYEGWEQKRRRPGGQQRCYKDYDFEVRHRCSKEIFRTFGFVIGTVIPSPQETFCKDLHAPFQFGELKLCSFSSLEKSLKREKSGPVIAGLREYEWPHRGKISKQVETGGHTLWSIVTLLEHIADKGWLIPTVPLSLKTVSMLGL